MDEIKENRLDEVQGGKAETLQKNGMLGGSAVHGKPNNAEGECNMSGVVNAMMHSLGSSVKLEKK